MTTVSNIMDERVGRLEVNFSTMQTDIHVVKSDLARMQGDVAKAALGIERLLERENTRPEALSWGKIGATISSTIAIIGGLWFAVTWLVDHASVAHRESIEKRFTQLEHRAEFLHSFAAEWTKDGRLLLLDDRVRRIEQASGVPLQPSWQTTTKR